MSRRTKRSKRAGRPRQWRSPLQLEAVLELDPEGKIVVHHRVVDTLGRMLKSGTITEPMVDAGRIFERQFILAQLDPLRAPDIRRVPGNGREPDPDDMTLGARQRVHGAMQALGGHDGALGSITWHVLGCGCSVHDWVLRQGWGARRVRHEQAQGMLIAALDLLAGYYGLKARRVA